jgi:hypothetical protein
MENLINVGTVLGAYFKEWHVVFLGQSLSLINRNFSFTCEINFVCNEDLLYVCISAIIDL